MTTIVAFQPSLAPGSPPFQFQATLDGQLYNCTVTWPLYGQRWYVDIEDQSGNLIAHLPMVGSSNGLPLASLAWSTDNGGTVTAVAEEQFTAPLGPFRLGQVAQLTISGAVPTGYNALATCWITGPSTLIYPLAASPGMATNPGVYSYDINLLKGYFVTSTMVWRILNGNIEINP